MNGSGTAPYVVSILVENRPGVLARVASLFSARGYNIEGLSAAPTRGSDISRITCITWGNPHTMELIVKQLRNLVEVVGVRHAPMKEGAILAREMVIVRLKASGPEAQRALGVAKQAGARIVGRDGSSITVEITGDSHSAESALQALRVFEIVDMARSGPVALVPSRRERRKPKGSSTNTGGHHRGIKGARGPQKDTPRAKE
jgi:acetolactate synthase-1/3 small subunit